MENDARAFCNPWGRGREEQADSNISSGTFDHKDLLAEELNKLTVQEREQVYDEIHGVADVTEETPELVASCLLNMRRELARIPKPNRKALDRAIFLRPALETDDKFHMMFLRSDRFDAAKAAAKLCRHFEHKLMLFGDAALPRDITLEDLTEKEMVWMNRGANIFLSPQSPRGRIVRLLNLSTYNFDDWKSFLRYGWYQVMTALEDKELQKRGVVDVVNCYGAANYNVGEMISFLKRCSGVLGDWPMRNCGFHLCYGNPLLNSFIKFLQLIVGKDHRLRERTHFGSKLETQYKLLTFGIVLKDSFTEGHGSRSRESIDAYVSDRLQKEAQRKAEMQDAVERTGTIPFPIPADVLMGRSKKWPGNDRFASLISSHMVLYDQAIERLDKTVVAMEVLHQIKLHGGRFIKRTNEGWEVIEDQVASDKICQAMRISRLKQRNAPPMEERDASTSLFDQYTQSQPVADPVSSFPLGPNKRQRI